MLISEMLMYATVEVVVDDPNWNVMDLERIAQISCSAAISGAGRTASAYEIAVLAASDDRIADLNFRFRQRQEPTNVLSWPAATCPGGIHDHSAPIHLGDIALAWETCAAETTQFGSPLEDYVAFLLVHASLHLLGFDHATDQEAAQMEQREACALATLGIGNLHGCAGTQAVWNRN